MSANIAQEIASLGHMTVADLKKRHLEVFGETPRSSHRQFLVKRIAWRIQANAWGDLSTRARRRAEELANDGNLRTTAPRAKPLDGTGVKTAVSITFDHDPRLPMPGAILRRQYKGREIVVRVLPKGFEWEGTIFRSLSAVAAAITESHINGYQFFNLLKKGAVDEQPSQ